MTERARALKELADQLNNFDARIRALSRPQLAQSSIENGSLTDYDKDGTLRATIGEQWDGTHGVIAVNGPEPPMPSGITWEAATGGFIVRWDGFFADAAGTPDQNIVAPEDWTRLEIHVSPDPLFTAEFADTLEGTMESPRGTGLFVARDPGMYYVRAYSRTSSGKRSAATESMPVEVLSIVLEEIDAAQTRITNAAEMVVGAIGDKTVGEAINDAAASPVTDERLAAGSLTVWPFQPGSVPAGALEPGSVTETAIADFSIAVKKLRSDRHFLY